jgi:hypothetical protein
VAAPASLLSASPNTAGDSPGITQPSFTRLSSRPRFAALVVGAEPRYIVRATRLQAAIFPDSVTLLPYAKAESLDHLRPFR